jgi:hypothetical protein
MDQMNDVRISDWWEDPTEVLRVATTFDAIGLEYDVRYYLANPWKWSRERHAVTVLARAIVELGLGSDAWDMTLTEMVAKVAGTRNCIIGC